MRPAIERTLATAMDGAMCGMMNALQWRLRRQVCSRRDFEAYIARCSSLTREKFYESGAIRGVTAGDRGLDWDSPVAGPFMENNRVRMRVFPCPSGPAAPTVLLLHALMSANDGGYVRLARWFNERGWNAIFPHLPFHYSRAPRGFFNGELAVTANLIQNGETLRQAVVELRQAMAHFRAQGCRAFGIVGTSYGGWTGALLSFLEPDLRFVSLIQPIVDIEHAIWQNPASFAIRRQLRRVQIEPGASARHAHLSSPLHGQPLCGGDRVVLTAGTYDLVSPPEKLRELADRWPGTRMITVRQGHFGYTALRETLPEIARLV